MNTATVHQFPTPPTRRAPRVNSWRWNEDEDEAIDSLPIEAQIIYLRVFRKHMDYASGIVGIKRTVSYSQIKERLEYQPPVHSNEKVKEYSRGQIKRLIQKLVDAGLLERLHDTSKGVEKMIFRLPMACSDAETARHERDTGSATQQNVDETKADDDNRDTSATREARHPSGSPVTPNPLTTFEGSTKKSRPKKWGEDVDHEIAEWMGAIVDGLPGGKSKRNITNWANTVRLMRTKDEREPVHIKRLFEWATGHKFWQGNIHSPDALREQWKKLAIQCNNEKTQGNTYANRPGTDEKRANQDRIAAMLSDPNDTSWIEGLFPDEESGDLGAGQSGVHSAGGDLPQDVENGIFDAGHGEAGKAGSGYIDGEVVNTAHDQEPGRSTGANQGRGWGVAAERGEADFEHEAEAGGFWNA